MTDMMNDLETSQIPEAPRQKTAKELKREEKERIRRYRLEKKQEKAEAKASIPMRRVGTFTMGLSLIITGIFVIYWLFHPMGDPKLLVYFASAILILLGCEILYQNFFHGQERLKYDLMSGVICFFLVCGCLGVTALPIAYTYFGPERHITEVNLQQEIYDVCYEAMKDRAEISGLYVNVYLTGINYQKDMTYQDLLPADGVHIRIHLKNQFSSKEQFAAACQSLTQRINGTDVPYDYLNFDTDGEGIYQLSLSNEKFSQNLSAKELAERVEVNEPADSAEEGRG